MCGCGWAGCSQRNVQQYRRTAYSSTTACKSHRALASVLNPRTHAAQQIGPFASVRQEITPCCVWSFSLNLRLRCRRRGGGRCLTLAAQSRGEEVDELGQQHLEQRRLVV